MLVQRFQLMETSSFRELDGGWRDRLAWLHDDYFYSRQVLSPACVKVLSEEMAVWAATGSNFSQ